MALLSLLCDNARAQKYKNSAKLFWNLILATNMYCWKDINYGSWDWIIWYVTGGKVLLGISSQFTLLSGGFENLIEIKYLGLKKITIPEKMNLCGCPRLHRKVNRRHIRCLVWGLTVSVWSWIFGKNRVERWNQKHSGFRKEILYRSCFESHHLGES